MPAKRDMGKAIFDTPDRPFPQAGSRRTFPSQKRAAKKARKPAALSSSRAEVFYHNLGASSNQCHECNTIMWIDHLINMGRGLYTFRINGQNCYRIRSLLPKDGTQPSEGVDGTIVGSLIKMFDHNKVAALITNDFGDGAPTRDIVVNKKDSGPKRILELHPSYMALQYPLLFPYGEDMYHDKILYHSNTGTHKTKRQYLVDAYTAIEEQRLSWTRNNQDPLRVDLYHNVCNAVTMGDTNAASRRKRIVLPHTFTGGPRYMMQNYQDAMALCRAYGNPDLFITFTSNPKWLKINEMLACVPGQRAHDRPEVGTSVFKLKLTKLLDDLIKNQVFGESRAGNKPWLQKVKLSTISKPSAEKLMLLSHLLAVVYVIEFEMCGLPHTHILLWLKEHCKCKTPADIDDIISADLPSPTGDPAGYKAVTDYMLHGPCGKDTKYSTYNVEGKCLKHFPKPFCAKTIIDQDGYPIYCRRENKVFVKKGNGHELYKRQVCGH
ncbi:helicase [Tanacetum coccineum]